MPTAKDCYLFEKGAEWFLFEDGLVSLVPNHLAQEWAENGLPVRVL